MDPKEIIIPHDLSRGPLVAVRRMLVHSSIAELQELGMQERYRATIDPMALAEIDELIGPGWMPLKLAVEHYGACDRLRLDDAQILDAGLRAGDKMGSALLVAGAQSATKDGSPWAVLNAFSRMGRRVYEGGSSQYVKVGPRALLIEHIRNPLFAFHYYRVAHAGFLRKSFANQGVEITDVSFSAYRADKSQVDFRVTWR